MITIPESGMNFGPFDENDVCQIEKSMLYGDIKDNVQMAEFILKQNKKLIFIEAKSSSPRQLQIPVEINKANKIETVEYPSPYIVEIYNKLNNALNLLLSANLKCTIDENKEILDFVDLIDFNSYKIKFYLVINGHKKEWLSDVQDALQKQLLPQMKIWNIDVKVINDEIAKQYKLIS
ncbi:MAG: hypothetical protein PHS59_12180 [Paludibacter sp.]|nr:hypothetical protein [Paludibacter sp.]